MANPVTVTTRPQFLNANTNIYTAWDLRKEFDSQPTGPGVADYESFRVLPRQSGVGLAVDVGKTAVGYMQAWVRGSTRGGQGLYRVDNTDALAPTTDTYLSQLTVDVAANASGNPRLDIVILEIADQQHAGGSNLAQVRVISGTASPGATLDNRTGVAAVPANAVLLADILLASGDTTVDAVDIRDRRSYCLSGCVPAVVTAVDMVAMSPAPGMTSGTKSAAAAFHSTHQAAALMFLPRRIAGATMVRWRYQQGATANAGNWIIGIYDSTGRKVMATSATAFAGAAGVATEVSATVTATTFEAGWYYVMIGLAAMTASSSVFWHGAVLDSGAPDGIVIARNHVFRATSGGTALPTTLLGLTDGASLTVASNIPPVPAIALSVG